MRNFTIRKSKIIWGNAIHCTDLYQKDLHLLAVALHESRMKEIFARVSDIIRVNLPGPGLYIEFYNDYFWLLDGTADEQLQTFLDREPNFKVCI